MCKNIPLWSFQGGGGSIVGSTREPVSCIGRCGLWHLGDCQSKKLNMNGARGLEGRQLKWTRRKTGLRFFEHPPKLAPGLPRCPAASMISPCWHQGVLATHLARRSSHLLTRHQVDQSILTQGKVRLKKHGTFCWQSIKPEMFQSGPRIACIGLC